MTTNVKKVLHAGISVYNMEESLAWYKKNLGFEVVKNDGYVPPLKAKIVFIEKDGFQIELFEYDEPKKIPEDRSDTEYRSSDCWNKTYCICNR